MTNGLEIFALVKKTKRPESLLTVEGVGRITKNGLEQPMRKCSNQSGSKTRLQRSGRNLFSSIMNMKAGFLCDFCTERRRDCKRKPLIQNLELQVEFQS